MKLDSCHRFVLCCVLVFVLACGDLSGQEEKDILIGQCDLADSLYGAGDYAGSKARTLALLDQAEEMRDEGLLVSGYLLMVKNERRLRHERSSNAWFRKLKSVANANGFEAELAEGALTISHNFQITNEFDSAMTYVVMALGGYERLGDSLGIVSALGQMGTIKIQNKDLEGVAPLFERASEIAHLLNDSLSIMNAYHQTGLLYQKQGALTEAIPYYLLGYDIALQLKKYQRAAVFSGNIGSTMVTDGRPAEGLPYLEEALRLKQEHNARGGSICHTLMDLSTLYYDIGDYDLSIAYANEMLQLADSIGDTRYTQFAYLNLALAKNEAGASDVAFQDLMRYSGMRDSLFNVEKAKQIQELQVVYESEKKDQEISALEQTSALQRLQKRLSLTLVIAILLVAIGVFYQQRLRAKKNRELLEKEKEVDVLKNQFFANISHEFRTPLTLILGPIQEKLDGELNDKERQEFKRMERNAIRLQRLITDILDLTKSEDGSLKLEEEDVDLGVVINGIVGSFSSLADSNQIDFQLNWEGFGSHQMVLIDRGKIETVLINLLSNAFKFTPKGGLVKVEIELRNEGGQDRLFIAVADSGPGIPADQLERVFDRFYQVDNSEARKQLGTGIGLAFSRELVHLMKGKIWVESEYGNGAQFFVEVDLSLAGSKERTTSPAFGTPSKGGRVKSEEFRVKSEEGRVRSEELRVKSEGLSVKSEGFRVESEVGGPPPSPLQRGKDINEVLDEERPVLLIVDDNEDVCAYLISLFEDDYHIVTAVNGELGLDKALETIPDVIVSDVMMPVMDGFEMCGHIKKDMRTSHIPLILLTAKNAPESRITGLEIEADVYMSKPFHPKELRLQVRNLLKLHQNIRDRYQASDALVPVVDNPESMEQRFLNKLSEAMDEHYADSEFKVDDLSKAMSLSRSQLHRKLKSVTDETTTEFMRTFRLKKAKELLLARTGIVSEIAYQVGFNNVSYFNKCFLEKFGVRPGEMS